MLINTLKEELSCMSEVRERYGREQYRTEPHFTFKGSPQPDRSIISEEYEILKAQYEDLQC
jgi:hypothetical protein